MRKIQHDAILINGGKTKACFLTFKQGHKIRYEIRRGQKGTGKVLASESCTFGYFSQKAATDKLAALVGGIKWEEEELRDGIW